MHSPNIIDMCLTSYCPTQQNCFAFEKQDDYVDSKYHNLIDEIHKTLYNGTDKNEFYRNIAICLFGVFNISRCANNPPPIQYIDINHLKQITYSTQKQNTIIQPIFEKLKTDIERFDMQYLNTYKYLTEVLLQYGKRKESDDIKINKIIDIKADYKHSGDKSSIYMNRNPKKKYTKLSYNDKKQKHFLMGYSRDNDKYDIDVKNYLRLALFESEINQNDIKSGPDGNDIITYLIDNTRPHKGDNIGYAQIVKNSQNTTDITYSKMTEDGSTYKNKTIKEIIKEIIDEIDTSNAASAVGVLEFLDQMTKFSTSNTLCFLENDKYDLVDKEDIAALDRELKTYGK